MKPVITSYCRVKNYRCIYNDREIESPENSDVTTLLTSLYRSISNNYPKFFKMDNLSKAGFIGSELILKDIPTEDRADLGLLIMNKSASLDSDLTYFRSVKEGFPSPSLFVYTLPNIVLGEIAIRNKCYGENLFFVSDRFDIDHLITLLNYNIENRISPKIVTGWIECDSEHCDLLLILIERGDSVLGGLKRSFTKETIENLYYV